jgi:FtsP/CotA-like multicopper oxidase with cupredoxin domain
MLAIAVTAVASLLMSHAQAAVPGIKGTNFSITASAEYTSQPDGASIYSWGYGCSTGFVPTFVPFNGNCPLMQIPGPTMIVTEGTTVSVTLTNGLPPAAGNTSIIFPGFQVTSTGGVDGVLTKEAARGTPVTYTFVASKPGTYAYYSGSQPDVQIAMGLYGAVIVLPSAPDATCTSHIRAGETPFALASSAYTHPATCYDREYLFQFSEIDARLNNEVLTQVQACSVAPCPPLSVSTEPYQPQYFLVNGRSMPDDMDKSYSANYIHQPYNGNPHMHPGDLMLLRVIGQGRYQHPFHIHGNHARVLGVDGNLIQVKNDTVTPARLAGPLLFTIPTVSGQAMDLIYSWTGQGLNWDVYGRTTPHTCNGRALSANPNDAAQQSAGFDPDTHEYCPDHGKAIPVIPPDPNIVAAGLWYGGTPYLGMQAASPNPLPPGANIQNPDAGYAYMWHSHAEREITTNNVFPGGIIMMMIIDPPATTIDETQ